MAAGINLQVVVYYGPEKISIRLDRREVIPDDPGAGTPAMVHVGNHSATYWCASDTGELDGGDYQLSDRQVRWLRHMEHDVHEFLYNGDEE